MVDQNLAKRVPNMSSNQTLNLKPNSPKVLTQIVIWASGAPEAQLHKSPKSQFGADSFPVSPGSIAQVSDGVISKYSNDHEFQIF